VPDSSESAWHVYRQACRALLKVPDTPIRSPMHFHALDTYLPGESPVHRLDPRVKLALTVLFILTAALTPDRA